MRCKDDRKCGFIFGEKECDYCLVWVILIGLRGLELKM